MHSNFLQHQLENALERIHLETLVSSLGRIFLIWILAYICVLIIKRVFKRILTTATNREVDPIHADEVNKRYGAILQLGLQAIKVLIVGICIMITFKEIGIDIAPLLASAGVVGLAIGFGAQNLVRDFVTGFFMIIENQIRVGDVVTINGTGGAVEKITLRTITLRDVRGTLHIFPNGTINMVSNASQQFAFHVFDLSVAYKEDVDQVSQLIREVLASLKNDANLGTLMLDEGEIFGLDNFGDSAIVIKGRIKVIPGKQWTIGREFNRRIKQIFDKNQISIPFPQREVWVHQLLDSQSNG